MRIILEGTKRNQITDELDDLEFDFSEDSDDDTAICMKINNEEYFLDKAKLRKCIGLLTEEEEIEG